VHNRQYREKRMAGCPGANSTKFTYFTLLAAVTFIARNNTGIF
jgi:hypothetical protein